ncbi:MAG: sterol desaturase family protein [Cyclobacteriaceae bacterium]|nr:sterol desaturase family protein [Cyclobacteriaceae bacterium]
MAVIKIMIVIATFLFMEFVAWFTHKYVMHGLLWSWHRSHHTHRKGVLEKNDLFAVVFSIPAIILIITGSLFPSVHLLMYVGFGITAYGVFYILFHDILVHRRIKIKYKPRSKYLKRLVHAHYIHHQKHTKQGCQAFGFLYAPEKYEPSRDH